MKNLAKFYNQYLPISPSPECSHLQPSMLQSVSPDEIADLDTEPRYNGFDLDDIELNSKMTKARKNQRYDIARKEIQKGEEEEKKYKSYQRKAEKVTPTHQPLKNFSV